MLLLKRTITFLTPVVIFILFEILYFNPNFFWQFFALIQVLLLFTIWFLTSKRFKNFLLWNFLITPHLFIIAAWFFIIFLENKIVLHGIAVFSAIILGIFLEEIYVYFNLPKKYYPYSLENISNYINLITVFLFFSSIFSLMIFWNFNMWYSLLAVVCYVSLLVYQTVWVNKIQFRASWIFLAIITLILAELFFAISFLPTGFYVNSMILTVSYYLLVGLSRHHLLDSLEPKLIKKYLIIGFLAVIVAFATAQWM